MFARNVSIRLKPNSLKQFTETFDKTILPILKKQSGFRDEITLASEDQLFVNAISIWDTKEQAEAYNTAAYPEVVKSMDQFLDGPPKVRPTSVTSSTFHKVAAVAA